MKKIKQKIMVIAVALLIPSFSFASETLILYYTRTGTNKIIAEYIQSQIQGSTIAEITTKDDRSGFFGFITCLFDQWFDREADINELTIKPEDYTTIIMCSPIWMQNLSSPARTFIKQSDLKDKPLYLFITYGGRLNDEKKKTIEKWLIEQGVALKGVYGSAVGGKTEKEITKQTKDHLHSANLLSEESM
jgi:menaquinone-dependent protoporphyrinogen IX oxidase